MTKRSRIQGDVNDLRPVFNRGSRLIIEEQEFYLGDATSFNAMLNEVSQIGEFPNLLDKSFVEGKILFNYDGEPTDLRCSAKRLQLECRQLLEEENENLSDESRYILSQLLRGVNTGLVRKVDITIK